MKTNAKQRGFTLVEVLGSIAVFALGALAFISAALSAESLQEQTRGRFAAMNAARQLVERMQAEDFETVFTSFNAEPLDDPEGAGTAIGDEIDLTIFDDPDPRYATLLSRPPQGKEAFPFRMKVDFPVNVGAEGVLLERTTGTEWPELDLNADGAIDNDVDDDGVIDANDHASGYEILPVKITVEWDTDKGTERFEFRTILARR